MTCVTMRLEYVHNIDIILGSTINTIGKIHKFTQRTRILTLTSYSFCINAQSSCGHLSGPCHWVQYFHTKVGESHDCKYLHCMQNFPKLLSYVQLEFPTIGPHTLYEIYLFRMHGNHIEDMHLNLWHLWDFGDLFPLHHWRSFWRLMGGGQSSTPSKAIRLEILDIFLA